MMTSEDLIAVSRFGLSKEMSHAAAEQTHLHGVWGDRSIVIIKARIELTH